MTLQLLLTPDEEARLSQAAEAQGIGLTDYVRILLGLEKPSQTQPSVEEWEAALDEISDDVDPSVPPLSDEMLSRRNIYGRRG